MHLKDGRNDSSVPLDPNQPTRTHRHGQRGLGLQPQVSRIFTTFHCTYMYINQKNMVQERVTFNLVLQTLY